MDLKANSIGHPNCKGLKVPSYIHLVNGTEVIFDKQRYKHYTTLTSNCDEKNRLMYSSNSQLYCNSAAFGMERNRAPLLEHKPTCQKWTITFDKNEIVGSQETKNKDKWSILVKDMFNVRE